jgi:hypothetical protein
MCYCNISVFRCVSGVCVCVSGVYVGVSGVCGWCVYMYMCV